MSWFSRHREESVYSCDPGCVYGEALPGAGDDEWRFCRRRGMPVKEGIECATYRGRGAADELATIPPAESAAR